MYTFLTLLGLVLSGILLNNVINMYNINRNPKKGNFSLKTYMATEWLTILISVMIGTLACFLRKEIITIPYIKDYIGITYVTIGYLGQYLLIAFMGKAKKTIDDKFGNQ